MFLNHLFLPLSGTLRPWAQETQRRVPDDGKVQGIDSAVLTERFTETNHFNDECLPHKASACRSAVMRTGADAPGQYRWYDYVLSCDSDHVCKHSDEERKRAGN